MNSRSRNVLMPFNHFIDGVRAIDSNRDQRMTPRQRSPDLTTTKDDIRDCLRLNMQIMRSQASLAANGISSLLEVFAMKRGHSGC